MVNYKDYITFTKYLGGLDLQIVSKPGLPYWDQLTPASSLIIEHVKLEVTDRVLFLGVHHGAAAAGIGQQNHLGELLLTDQSSIALTCARQTLKANNIQHGQTSTQISLLPELSEHFEKVVIESPKGRLLNHRWLVEAFSLLRIDGEFYLAGSNELGIQSVARDAAELFGNSSILDYKKGARIHRLVKTTQNMRRNTWSSEPGVAPGSWITYPLTNEGRHFSIHTLPGVFSSGGLDPGTELLLEKIGTPGVSRILDVGCGCGVIGIVLANRLQKANCPYSLDMVDSDLYAVSSARKNILESRIPHLQVYSSDLLETVAHNSYDLIVSNPPFHAGKEVDYKIAEALIYQSHQSLDRGGRLVVVANQFIRYEKLLRQIFDKVTILSQNNRFHLISAEK